MSPFPPLEQPPLDTHHYTCHNTECSENDIPKIGPDVEEDAFCGSCGEVLEKTVNSEKSQ